MDSDQLAHAIVRRLSLLIADARRHLEGECRHPGFDPDRMDDRIKDLTARVAMLSRMREEFEAEISKPI